MQQANNTGPDIKYIRDTSTRPNPSLISSLTVPRTEAHPIGHHVRVRETNHESKQFSLAQHFCVLLYGCPPQQYRTPTITKKQKTDPEGFLVRECVLHYLQLTTPGLRKTLKKCSNHVSEVAIGGIWTAHALFLNII